MGKKKKNSNYVTEKREQARIEKEKERRAKKRNKILKAVLIPTVAVAVLAALIFVIGLAVGWWYNNPNKDLTVTHHATIKIKDYGSVHIELYGEEAPETVANFVALANRGHYDGLAFHRIMNGFMAQGGENPEFTPAQIKGEFSENGVNNNVKHVRGTISMARTDVMDSATDQFFIVHKTSKNNTLSLDGRYAAFGMVTDGMNVIDKMIKDTVKKGYTEYISITSDRPVIESITIHEVHD